MKLKDDPRLQGQWPPTEWGKAGAPSAGSDPVPAPPSDAGFLVDVKCSDLPPSGHITLAIRDKGRQFKAQIILDDVDFRHTLCAKLQQCIGQTIHELGELQLDV